MKENGIVRITPITLFGMSNRVEKQKVIEEEKCHQLYYYPLRNYYEVNQHLYQVAALLPPGWVLGIQLDHKFRIKLSALSGAWRPLSYHVIPTGDFSIDKENRVEQGVLENTTPVALSEEIPHASQNLKTLNKSNYRVFYLRSNTFWPTQVIELNTKKTERPWSLVLFFGVNLAFGRHWHCLRARKIRRKWRTLVGQMSSNDCSKQ